MILEDELNGVLQEDLNILADGFPLSGELEGSSVLVTGSTGLIGSYLVKTLACMNRKHNLGMIIFASCRNPQKARKVFGPLLDRGDVVLVAAAGYAVEIGEKRVDYLIHCACPTGSSFFVQHPVDTIATIVDGTREAMDFARDAKVESAVYLSSLEVYGTPEPCEGFMTESEYGQLDCMSVRSSYSEGKRMAESICAAYCSQYGVPVKVTRLSQTFGPGVSFDDGRVFAEFARCAIRGKNIVLHTAGGTLRTYCYVRDAISGILTALLKGENGQAYNITNMETGVTIKEMAELVCSLYPEKGMKVEFDFPEDIASFGYNPEMVIRLDASKLQSLGWKPEVGLEEMFVRLIGGMVR